MKTVVFDFDGVIHSYTSGWQGMDVANDPPVTGIREAITEVKKAGYKVVVVSSRCSTPLGLETVKDYLDEHGISVHEVVAHKPPAVVYIDDRAICFDGNAKSLINKIQKFKPWYK